MELGRQAAVLDLRAARETVRHDECRPDAVRADERRRLRARLRSQIVPGLEQLADPAADPADLIALAAVHARRLRAELERPAPLDDPRGLGAGEWRAREQEREWIRGHLHDTALQILEFIAGDGFGTGLSAPKIANLAGGAARDLRRWLDSSSPAGELVPELEQVTTEARALDSCVRLVVGRLDASPTHEQVSALTGAVREAVTNARKHARATEVVVHVETGEDGETSITITDDGIGFDAGLADASPGLGVRRSILGRMRCVGGRASLEDAPGGGTLVTLQTPRGSEP